MDMRNKLEEGCRLIKGKFSDNKDYYECDSSKMAFLFEKGSNVIQVNVGGAKLMLGLNDVNKIELPKEDKSIKFYTKNQEVLVLNKDMISGLSKKIKFMYSL